MSGIRRARPWLGTIVDIRIEHADSACADRAIEAAFARAVTHAERAKTQMLGAFATSPERDGLVALADYVISRDR